VGFERMSFLVGATGFSDGIYNNDGVCFGKGIAFFGEPACGLVFFFRVSCAFFEIFWLGRIDL
jgi:hypothetical protein